MHIGRIMEFMVPIEGRDFRGGSWAEVANSCGSTIRRKSMPDFKIDDLGFRIACAKISTE